MSTPKCNCCGKFRKQNEIVSLSGESDDTGNYQVWLECKYCMSLSDYETYFQRRDKKEKE